jgi:hypothetical protein
VEALNRVNGFANIVLGNVRSQKPRDGVSMHTGQALVAHVENFEGYVAACGQLLPYRDLILDGVNCQNREH